MAYDYSYNSTQLSLSNDDDDDDGDQDWSADTSQFIFDSPQPTPQALPSRSDGASDPAPAQAAPRASDPLRKSHTSTLATTEVGSHLQPASISTPSSTSEDSSRESSENRLQYTSSTSPPPFTSLNMSGNPDSPSGDFKSGTMFMDMDDGPYAFDDSTFPMGEQGMNDLSLNNLDTPSGPFSSSAAAADSSTLSAGLVWDSPLNSSSSHGNGVASPRMTVQPSKMFQVGSREDSPNSVAMANHSLEGSPAPVYHNSPLSGNDGFTKAPQANYSNVGLSLDRQPVQFQSLPPQTSAPTSVSPQVQAKKPKATNWPCRLTVDQTPDKSRVETQIPIRLTLYDLPPGISKIHLPTHTISKPKFQAKPPHQKCEDTLELSTMLVCASAMQKDGVEDAAFKRALSDEVPVKHEDPSAPTGDDDDPNRPLNGGPVAICPGCIVRERKRAARKKTKKVDEEEEWAKDEAKRVIVFNCAEVRDWCVPGTKETPVKDHDAHLDHIFVQAPMRIACYCRHQSEKTGFQVIFTIKTHNGKVLAQAMSNSIMITDDHKQPIQHPQNAAGVGFPNASPVTNGGMFQQGYMVPQPMPTFQETMPFRTSYSTNDLVSMRRHQQGQFVQQMPQSAYYRSFQNDRSQASTASATPRNLSRPASPTDPTGQPSKKRRSGGAGKVPSGLTMTRLDTKENPSNMNTMASGAPSGGFNFQSPTASQFVPSMDNFAPSGMNGSNPYQSGPSTPHGGSMSGYGSPAPIDSTDPFGYYSAPTSQHPSRAPSPNSLSRGTAQQFPQASQAAADRLQKMSSALPAGLNLSRPPIIQRLIPPSGPRTGGEEVTVLGSGFFQGLEVMFGDTPATNTVFWGDTTLVCRAPPSAPGAVAVMFQHQHPSAHPETQQAVQQFQNTLMPTRLVQYNYTLPEQIEGFSQPQQHLQQQQPQQHGIDPNQLTSDAMTARFMQQQSLQNQGFDNYLRSTPQGPSVLQQQGLDQRGRQ